MSSNPFRDSLELLFSVITTVLIAVALIVFYAFEPHGISIIVAILTVANLMTKSIKNISHDRPIFSGFKKYVFYTIIGLITLFLYSVIWSFAKIGWPECSIYVEPLSDFSFFVAFRQLAIDNFSAPYDLYSNVFYIFIALISMFVGAAWINADPVYFDKIHSFSRYLAVMFISASFLYLLEIFTIKLSQATYFAIHHYFVCT